MQTLTSNQTNQLVKIAKKYLSLSEDEFSITPWITCIPPWNWLSKSPLFNTSLIVLIILITTIITNLSKFTLHFAAKNIFVALSVWMGFYFVFYFCKIYENLYFDVRRITMVPQDTLKRWFIHNVCHLWGFVNLRKQSERTSYTFLDTWQNDKIILFQFLFWSVINGLFALIAVRRFYFELSVGWFIQTFFCFLWAYSFMWTSHYGHSCIRFLLKLGRLPVRYCFYMPSSLTLKVIGGRMVGISWITSIHFWLLIGIFHFWGILKVHGGENPLVAAIVAAAISPVVILYLIWQFMIIAITQIALSKKMLEYKNKKLTEFFYHVEDVSNNFVTNPSDPNYKTLREKAKYRQLFRKLPVFSLSFSHTIAFACQLTITIFLLYVYFKYSIGGKDGLNNLLSPLFQ